MELVAAHADTQFGRDHSFARVRSYADFAAAAPVGDYETLRPYMDKVVAGDTAALLPAGEGVLMFSQTSGTTGKVKLIPVTQRFLTDIRRGWNVWGLMALRDHQDAWLRPILQISSSMREQLTARGVPCGAISGLLAATQKKIVRHMYPVPMEVADINDAAARYYTILRYGVGADVSFITTANPSSVIKLIETGQQHADRLIKDVADGTLTPPNDGGKPVRGRFRPSRTLARKLEEGIRRDGRLLPRHFWNLEFLGNWTGGTLKLYLRRLRELFGDVPVRDIGLLASEGRLTIPMADGTPAGVADIASNFLEFIPVEGNHGQDLSGEALAKQDARATSGAAAPATLRAHELTVGGEYLVVMTNWAGLWRYNLDDRVRVTGFYRRTPVLEFLSRGLHTANITGEKLTEHQVVEAMQRACAHGLPPGAGLVERFVLQGRFAATPYYELRFEPPAGAEPARLSELMDAALCELNVEYKSKRASGRLDAICPLTLPPGTLEAAERQTIAARRGRAEQYKHRYLLTEVLQEGTPDR